MHIKQQQQRDSVRVVWNVMPDNKTLQSKAAIPQALHYTPLQYKQDSLINHTPPKCPTCSSYMNVYSPIHLTKQHYTCCICEQINEFPPDYIKKNQQLPPELSLDYSSFLIAKKVKQNNTKTGYLFVVDVAISQKQLESIKTAIIDLINTSSEDYVVGLVTYAKYVQLYDLTASINTFLAFAPNNQYNIQKIANLIGYANSKIETIISNKYLPDLKNRKKEIIQNVSNLKRIVPQTHKHQRQARAVGQALNIALTLNQLSLSNPQIIFFCGGVCTIGAGKIIDQDYKIQMRSIKDQTPKMSKTAIEFYNSLLVKSQKKSIAIHSFIFSMQEVGLTEMIHFLTATGGLLVQHEQFDSEVFKNSFKKAFIGSHELPQLEMAIEARMSINGSNDIKIESYVGDNILNQGGEQTQYIIIGNLDERSTFTIKYDLADVKATSDSYHIQFITTFSHPQDNTIQFERVTTIRRVFSSNINDIAAGFDEEAALSLLAKLTIQKSIDSSSEQLRHWLDNLLCKWSAVFARYAPNNRESFRLSNNMKSFPQYIYHLRRSAIVRKSGMSLDQYHYIGQIMKKQTVTNVVRMIQPALLEYSPEQPSAKGVSLDERHMKLQVILLLDSFFNIVQWHGKNIESWLQNDYQNQPQYEYLRELLQAPRQDIKLLTSTRFPFPNYYLTCSGHSKERFLKSRLSNRLDQQSQNNLSDQADITSFTERLIDLVVNRQI